MLKIWGRASSSNVQKVLWTAAELGIAFERIDAGGTYGRTDAASYRAMNPNGLVPTIEDDGFVVWESNTICRYLASKHQSRDLYPQELQGRANVERWQDWGSTVLAPAIFPSFYGLIRAKADERDDAAIRASAATTACALAILDRELAGRDYLCGPSITLADIAVGINCHRWYAMDYASAGYERPTFEALGGWYARLCERAAYREWVKVRVV